MEKGKFDPQPTPNPWTYRHQIWTAWLGRGPLKNKKWVQSAHGLLLPI